MLCKKELIPILYKRIIRVFAGVGTVGVIFACICSGCAEKSQSNSPAASPQKIAETLNASYTSTMEIAYHDIKAVATLDQQFPGNYKLSFTEPEVMNGMILETEGQTVNITYRGLSARFTTDQFFNSTMAKTVITTLNNVTAQDGLEFTMEDNSLAITGKGNTGDFQLIIDPQNGNLMKLNIPEQELSINFKDFRFLSAAQ